MRKATIYNTATAAAISTIATIGLLSSSATPAAAQFGSAEQFGKEALKAVAIGYAVKQTAGPLNQFINAVTLRNGLQDRQTTKVVPMLSVGDKTYIGGAQVSGPASLVSQTQAVWQVEGSKTIGDGVYRAKALIPSNSLNPLALRRVQKVGVTAIIDVATGGPLKIEGPYSRPLRGGDIVKAGAVAVGVNAAARQINDFVNAITFNRSAQSTKVVPMATFGEKAFVGAAQLSGSSTTLPTAKTLWQYEDLFDRGRFRVKILIPTNGIDPRNLRRVSGVGLTALIDTSIQRQANSIEPRRQSNPPIAAVPPRNPSNGDGRPVILEGGRYARLPSGEIVDLSKLPPGQLKKLGLGRPDNGKHKGWNKDRNRGGDDDDEDDDEKRGKGRGKGKGKGDG
jgi:hypothetical protein